MPPKLRIPSEIQASRFLSRLSFTLTTWSGRVMTGRFTESPMPFFFMEAASCGSEASVKYATWPKQLSCSTIPALKCAGNRCV